MHGVDVEEIHFHELVAVGAPVDDTRRGHTLGSRAGQFKSLAREVDSVVPESDGCAAIAADSGIALREVLAVARELALSR